MVSKIIANFDFLVHTLVLVALGPIKAWVIVKDFVTFLNGFPLV